MTLAGTAFASIRVDLLVGSCAGSLLAAFLTSSVPTVVTAFVDIDPTLGGTPLGPPSAVEQMGKTYQRQHSAREICTPLMFVAYVK
jgi:hypothetical protein